MATPLSLKRRRLNDATNKLTKPFVSPLRRPPSDATPSLSPDTNLPPTEQSSTYTPSIHAHTIPRTQTTRTHNRASTRSTTTPRPNRHTTTPHRPLLTPRSSTRAPPLNPEELACRKSITKLDLEIRATQTSIDTLERAHRIQNSPSDADLTLLISKWRSTAQLVAEELFGSVKERVQRMGGVGAWRDAEREKFERVNEFQAQDVNEEEEGDDRDCEFDEQGEELPLKEQEYRKALKRQARKEMREAVEGEGDSREQVLDEQDARPQKIWMEQGAAEDDSFTLDMMLRSLNIDLDIIGYDRDLQKWCP